MEGGWGLPIYHRVPPLAEQQFRFEVVQELPNKEIFRAVGELQGSISDAQKSAASALLAAIAEGLRPSIAALRVSPDFVLPDKGANFISCLNLLCQKHGWSHSVRYKKMPLLVGEGAGGAAIFTFVTVVADGQELWARSQRATVKEAKQEAAGRLLLFLAASGRVTVPELPAQLQQQQQGQQQEPQMLGVKRGPAADAACPTQQQLQVLPHSCADLLAAAGAGTAAAREQELRGKLEAAERAAAAAVAREQELRTKLEAVQSAAAAAAASHEQEVAALKTDTASGLLAVSAQLQAMMRRVGAEQSAAKE